jgi:hypothetical protein
MSTGVLTGFKASSPESEFIDYSLWSVPEELGLEAQTREALRVWKRISRKRKLVESLRDDSLPAFSTPLHSAHLAGMDEFDEQSLFDENAPAAKRQRTTMEEIEIICSIGEEGGTDSDDGAEEEKELSLRTFLGLHTESAAQVGIHPRYVHLSSVVC